MKLNPDQTGIFESPHQQSMLTKPNPPTPEMVERAQFVDKTYVWNNARIRSRK
jgi:hypothetical protein